MRRFLSALLITLILSGCGSTPMTMEGSISIANAYLRATNTEMGPWMTGAFMEITNNTDADITLTGGTAEFASRVEVHEVLNGNMQMKQGGLIIKAGTTEVLQPGGNHLMFVNMATAAKVGEERSFSLSFSDGSSVAVTAPVKEVALGGESYDDMNM